MRGASAELLLILRSTERSDFDYREFVSNLSRWCALYREEPNPSLSAMVKMAESVSDMPDLDSASVLKLSDLAETFLT